MSYKLLGAIIGGALAFVGTFIWAVIYGHFFVKRGGDPTAVGALWIFTFFTVPAGIIIGFIIGVIIHYMKQ